MSSVGQGVGGVVGAIVGFFTPIGPVYGAQIGMMIGGAIDPPKGPTINGPRLSDLSVQTSTYGAFIPRIGGTVAQVGNVFWVQGDKLIEVITPVTSGGKGGPPKTTTNTASYYASFAVGLCEGPIDGIRRIWIGNQLWYDAGSDDLQTIVASNEVAGLFTLYRGTDTQLPDPLIQADKGVANVPAYRGLAYLVFDRLPLAAYSNSLLGAQVKAEIVKSGTTAYAAIQEVIPSKNWKDVSYNGSVFCAVGLSGAVATSFDGVTWTLGSLPDTENYFSIAWNGSIFCVVGGSGHVLISPDGLTWTQGLMPTTDSWFSVTWSGSMFCAVGPVSTGAISTDGALWTAVSIPYFSDLGMVWNSVAWGGDLFCAVGNGGHAAVSSDGITWTGNTTTDTSSSYSVAYGAGLFCRVATGRIFTSPDGVTWTNNTPSGMVSHATSISWDGYAFLVSSLSTNFAWMSDDGLTWTQYTLPYTTSLNWQTTAGSNGVFYLMAAASTIGILFHRKITSNSTILSDIVQAECLTSNLLTAADLDVTELTDTVRGYRVTQLGAIRGSIDPLRAAFPFDVVQHGYQIKFARRGSASVATIASTELDARAAGDAPGVQITTVREMDSVLPRRVSVNYADVTREYDVNQQYAERLNTDAVSEKSVDLPIVFNATEGAQKAETLLYMYWMERYDVSLRLPPTYAELEPGDVITVTSPAADYELRLTSVNTLPDGRLECAAKFNQAALYTPTAIGEEGQSTGGLLTLGGPCVYSLLDIPLLRDDDDTAGFPVAMSGYLSGWPGGVLYRSDDAGQTWSDLRGFTPGATMGYATTSLSAHGGTVYDFASTLTAKFYSGAPASVTEPQLFAGQNWFAYGADGRWEIIAARTGTLQVDGSYILQDLLRGQQGTEWATGLHAVNDRIVLLDTSNIAFVSVNSSTIGAARDYRAITTGKTLDSDSSLAFTYRGVNLECLSPVGLTGNRNPSTSDWTLTWIRRSRMPGWYDLVDVPLGETSESYEIDIYSDGTYTTVKRTLTAATPTVAYTSAQQTTDFGSNQATLYLKLYQLSATVGRGYALTQSLTR
ncbi:phage tail protein [Thiobacillus sp.]